MKLAIIGAGVAGLSLASLLKDHAEVQLFEKSRGLGGRMSSRRALPYAFDHGAQYFTARSAEFKKFIQPWKDKGLIRRWNARYVKFDEDQIIEHHPWVEGEPRYVGVPGMSAVAKMLSQGLHIELNTDIKCCQHREKWTLIDSVGSHYGKFDWVISTVPAPQAAVILPQTFKHHAAVKAIQMSGCVALMLGFERGVPLSFDAAHVTGAAISWIAVNSSKPGRAHPFSLIAHSSKQYAKAHVNETSEEVMQHLLSETSRLTGHDLNHAQYKAVHRWRYAHNVHNDAVGPLYIDKESKLAACGDWCLGGRVEGAFTSALRLANALKESFL